MNSAYIYNKVYFFHQWRKLKKNLKLFRIFLLKLYYLAITGRSIFVYECHLPNYRPEQFVSSPLDDDRIHQ